MFLQLFAGDVCRKVNQQGQHHQDAGDGKSDRCFPALIGIDIQGYRQRSGGGLQRLEESVEHQSKAGSKQQSCRLTYDTSDGKDTAGDDAVHCIWQNNGANHVPFACAQTQRTLSIGLRNGL